MNKQLFILFFALVAAVALVYFIHNEFLFFALLIAIIFFYLVEEKWIKKELSRISDALLQLRNHGNYEKFVLVPYDPFVKVKNQLNNLFEESNFLFETESEIMSSLRDILNLLHIPVFVMDKKGRVLIANGSCNALKKANVKCENCFYYEYFYSLELMDLIAESLNKNVENREVRVGGRIYKANSFHRKLNSEREVVIFVLNDITEQVEKEIMEREFISAVSHELKTPLSVISGALDILKEEQLTESEKMEFIERMESNVYRMNGLVRELLILTEIRHRENIAKARINLKDCIVSILDAEKHFVKEYGFSLHLNLEDVWILGDSFLVKEMIKNIVENALKYSKGSEVSVTLKKGDFAEISIKDNGIGIDEADVEHIFEPFYRLEHSRSRKGGGTGLGLTIAKRVAELHKGHITVRSTRGRGTEFIIQMPFIEN